MCRGRALGFVAVAALVGAGCAQGARGTVRAARPVVQPETPRGPYAPAGATLRVRLHTEISTWTSTAGTPFVAEAIEPLLDAAGHVLVPAGAPLLGHVDELDVGGARPRVVLGFDAVETTRGPSALSATIARAQDFVTPEGAAPRALGYARVTSQLTIPAGAEIDLRLTRPLP